MASTLGSFISKHATRPHGYLTSITNLGVSVTNFGVLDGASSESDYKKSIRENLIK